MLPFNDITRVKYSICPRKKPKTVQILTSKTLNPTIEKRNQQIVSRERWIQACFYQHLYYVRHGPVSWIFKEHYVQTVNARALLCPLEIVFRISNGFCSVPLEVHQYINAKGRKNKKVQKRVKNLSEQFQSINKN